MRGGAKSFIYLACLAAGGCAASSETADLKIRPIPNASAKLGAGSALLAEAQAQLALGNVGLALEGFRKALREQPASADAYAGLAHCYEAMGRSDLAQTNYEAALALAPRNPSLLTGVAVSLDRQGETEAAAAARRQASALTAAGLTVDPRTAELPFTPAAVELGSSVTVALPPARPIGEMASAGPSITVDLPPAERASTDRVRRIAAALQPSGAGPYLERLSPGEVALVTDGRPAWKPQVVAQTRTSTTVRWVPIRSAEARPNIRVLNAAQRQGLAANARALLLDRGWRKIEIGDAAELRDRSVVLYPASRRTLGRSLAAQFGFPAQLQSEGSVLIVLLGRDAPVRSSTRG